jgi:DNA-binding NarL/FixJ family response regulator
VDQRKIARDQGPGYDGLKQAAEVCNLAVLLLDEKVTSETFNLPWPGTTRQGREPMLYDQPLERPATRVAVIDAHPLTRLGLVHVLQAESDLVLVEALDTAAAGNVLLAEGPVDVVVISTTLADTDAMAFARQLRDRYPALGIVMLTDVAEDDVLFRALESGASAFVLKHAPLAEVLAAIRHSAAAASSFLATGLADALRRRSQRPAGIQLSTRELEVLHLLSDGLAIPAIAARLYVSVSTAKTYVARLYDKLGVNNRAQALMTATRLGVVGSSAGSTA